MTSSHTPISPRPRGFVDAAPRGIRRIEHVMGMPVIFEICDPGVGPEPIQQAIDWLHRADARFSTYRRDSEISRLNHGELDRADVHHDVAEILARCERMRLATEGYFDIAAPYAPGGLGPDPGRAVRDRSIPLAMSRAGPSTGPRGCCSKRAPRTSP